MTQLSPQARPPAAPQDGRARRSDTVPFARAVPLGRWAGVPITAHWTVLATIVIFADILATSALPAILPHRSPLGYWLTGALTALAFLITLLAHELAHAVVARHYGMTVKRITLWMLGGFTELDGEAPSPRADALIAGVGPAVSLVLGGLGVGAVWAFGGSGLATAALAWLAGANLLLGVFNLLPGAPLDGGRLLRALLWWRSRDRLRATVNAARVGRVLGTLLVALGFVEVLAGSWGGLWLALVGMFLQTSALSEQTTAVFARLRNVPAGQVMTPIPVAIPEWWTLEQLAAAYPHGLGDQPLVLVDFPGTANGILNPATLRRVPPAEHDQVRLRELTRLRGERLLRVGADAHVEVLLPLLATHGGVAVVVDEAQRPLGVLTLVGLRQAAQHTDAGPAAGWTHPVSVD